MAKWTLHHRFLLLFSLFLALSGCSSLPPVKSEEPEKYVLAPHASDARFFFTRSGLRLFGQWWVPSATPKAVVLLAHGTVLHSGFYDPWASDLTEHGYAVFGIDLRGWGQSQGFGRRGGVNNYDEYIEDIEIARREIRRRFPNRPVYLQGESLGGAVVLMADMTGRVRNDGLILNAPAVRPNPSRMVGIPLPDGLMRFGMWSASQTPTSMNNAPILPIWNAFVGRVLTGEAADRFKKDPNATHTALPFSYINAIENASERMSLNLNNVRTPLIVLQGTGDALVPKSSSEFVVKQVQSADKTLKLYEGMKHNTLSEPSRDKVWSDIVGWLDTHAPQATAARAAQPDETIEVSDSNQDQDDGKTAFQTKYDQLTMTTTRN